MAKGFVCLCSAYRGPGAVSTVGCLLLVVEIAVGAMYAIGEKLFEGIEDLRGMTLDIPLKSVSCKLSSQFTGPNEIKAIISPSAVKLKLPTTIRVQSTFYISQVKPGLSSHVGIITLPRTPACLPSRHQSSRKSWNSGQPIVTATLPSSPARPSPPPPSLDSPTCQVSHNRPFNLHSLLAEFHGPLITLSSVQSFATLDHHATSLSVCFQLWL